MANEIPHFGKNYFLLHKKGAPSRHQQSLPNAQGHQQPEPFTRFCISETKSFCTDEQTEQDMAKIIPTYLENDCDFVECNT